MPIAVSLLRGINVGGHNKLRMADLRNLYTALDMRNPRTILQSGNVVFACEDTDLARAKLRIEAGIQERFGLDVQVMLRSAAEFRAAIAVTLSATRSWANLAKPLSSSCRLSRMLLRSSNCARTIRGAKSSWRASVSFMSITPMAWLARSWTTSAWNARWGLKRPCATGIPASGF